MIRVIAVCLFHEITIFLERILKLFGMKKRRYCCLKLSYILSFKLYSAYTHYVPIRQSSTAVRIGSTGSGRFGAGSPGKV